jgi:ABC-2 type transport system ATP-binding protein
VPTLFVQGINDTLFTINEATRNLKALRANGVPAKLILFSGGHGQIDDPAERRHINDRVFEWLARYLRHDRRVATGPSVEVYRDWAPGASHADRFASYPRWPVGRGMQLTLSSDGSLVARASAAKAGTVNLANAVAPTSYSEISNFQSGGGPNSPVDAGDHAEPLTATEFATPTLTRPTSVIGQPSLRFALSSTAGEAIVFWKLYDEAPDGSRSLVHHLVTPIRLLGEGTWPATAPITAPVSVTLAMQAIVHRFEAGHRIVLVAATSDTAHYGSRIPAGYQIMVGPDASLSLPVVP